MNILESILHFLTTLARIIFPGKKGKNGSPCPHPYPRALPDGHHPAVSPDGTNGSDPDSDRSDTLALHQGHWGTCSGLQPIDIAGYCLMAAGGIGCLYRWFGV